MDPEVTGGIGARAILADVDADLLARQIAECERELAALETLSKAAAALVGEGPRKPAAKASPEKPVLARIEQYLEYKGPSTEIVIAADVDETPDRVRRLLLCAKDRFVKDREDRWHLRDATV